MAELVDTNTNYSDRIKYRIKLLIGNTIIVTKYLLKQMNVPDIGSISISSKEYVNEYKNLT